MAAEGIEPYESKWFRQMLLKHLGSESLLITHSSKRNDYIVSFSSRTRAAILSDFYQQTTFLQQTNEE